MFMLSVTPRKKVSVYSSISISSTMLTKPLLDLFCKNQMKLKATFRMLLQLPNQRVLISLISFLNNSMIQMVSMKVQPMDLLLSVKSFYIFSSFLAMFKRHFENTETCAALLSGFRQYLHYHIHSSKSYLHGRVRKKVSDFHSQLKAGTFVEEG